MKSYLLAILLISAVLSCGRTEKPVVEVRLENSGDSASLYFPVGDFLKSEITQVDSLPVGIKFVRTVEGNTDSGYLERPEFRRLSQQFLSEEFDENYFRTNFKENAFFDNDIQRSVFNYLPNSNENGIRRVDVLSKEGDIYSKITGIYIEKNEERNDSLIISKMMWTPGFHFMINTQQSDKSGNSTISSIRVVWNTDTGE